MKRALTLAAIWAAGFGLYLLTASLLMQIKGPPHLRDEPTSQQQQLP